MKADAAFGRTTRISEIIAPHAWAAGRVLVVLALACGLAVGFGSVAGRLTSTDAVFAAFNGDETHTAILPAIAEPDPSRHPATSLTLPHVVDRWFDEVTALDELAPGPSLSISGRLFEPDRRTPLE
jgi:hypothetical protein